jgi:hypothetical protein
MIYMPEVEPLSPKQAASRRRFSVYSHSDGVRPMLESFKASIYEHPSEVTITIESPPLVFYGTPKESTGALLSGLLHLNVREEKQKFDKVSLVLNAEVLTRRPVSAHCNDCTKCVSEIYKWILVSEPVVLKKGIHSYPFSYLLPGHLPASNNNSLSKISYNLAAIATSSKGDEVKSAHPITLHRAILAVTDRHSIRIFPPTDLCATIKLPPGVYPGGDFPVDIRLDGVAPKRHTRWKLRKVLWRIDESARVVSPACKHHGSRLGGDGKGMLHESIRTVGSGELKSGWKSDFDTPGGKIEMEFTAGIPAHVEAACDVDSPCGITVSHSLIIELTVAEEHCPISQTRLTTPTGAARVLRTQFPLVVSDRSGLGISWDKEAPPVYWNVPAAPPIYFIERRSIAQWLPPVYAQGG